MNHITAVGRLTRDPELKTATTGTEFATFTIACDRFAGKDKEKATDFIDCIAGGQRGVAISTYLHKGDQIIVMGELTSNKGKKPETEKITYWTVRVNDFTFGAKKSEGGKETAPDPYKSAIPDESIPF